MKLIIASNEGIVIDEFKDVDRLDLSRDVDGWRVLAFVRAGVGRGKILNQGKPSEKKPP